MREPSRRDQAPIEERNDFEEGVRELARLEKWDFGGDHVEGPVRSRDSIKASLSEDVRGEAPRNGVSDEYKRKMGEI